MPTRTGVKRKAKSATVPALPPSSKQAKKRTTGNAKGGDASTTSTTRVVGLARRFISSLAKQLATDSELDGSATTGTASLVEVESVFGAALGALPEGKLKRELQRDEAATIQQLAAELGALNSSHTVVGDAAVVVGATTSEAIVHQRKGVFEQRKKGKRGGAAREKSEVVDTTAADTVEVVPCTTQLYGVAREKALRNSNGSDAQGQQQQNSSLLRVLALNPRAPLDLLVDAMWEASAGAQARANLLSFLENKQAPRPAAGSVPIGATLRQQEGEGDEMDVDARVASSSGVLATTLKSAVDGMGNLVKVLAADPNAAVSASGLAFYAHRAAVLSEAARGGVLREGAGAAAGAAVAGGANGVAGGSSGVDSTVTEALGLMLRILQVAELASSAAPFAPEGGGAPSDAADKLLLPCVPETTRTCSGDGSTVVPAARRSIARLLADYAVILAACSAGRKEGAAAALIKNARVWAAGGGDQDDDSSSSSSSDDEESDEEEAALGGTGAGFTAASGGNGVLSRHLLALCAAHLSGDEGATLEFLRCVGDACFVPRAAVSAAAEDGSGRRQQQCSLLLLSAAASASLARPCARALSRLPRPSASPAPTATLFLKRAYAARVVETLGRTPEAPKTPTTTMTSLQKWKGHRAATTTATIGDGDNNAARSWDFVGAAPAPGALLDFLGRSEAPVAVGGGDAGIALKALAARRESAAAVGELLRSSKACAPAGLGALLAAMERFGEVESGQDTESSEGGGGGGGGQGNSGQEDEVGGFFVDKDGSSAEGEAAAAAGGSGGGGGGVVFSSRGVVGGDDVQDMDEEEEEEEEVSEDEGSEEDADALGFVVDTDGDGQR